MANRYISEDVIKGAAEKSSAPEMLYVDLPGDQRTRPIMCATEFSNTGIHKKKSTSFQITSVTVQGSRLSNDGGEDSADDLDESHTEDISSDILDCSKTTDLDNDPLSSDNSNATLDDLGVSSKQFIPVKVLTSDPDVFGASDSPGVSIDNTIVDSDVTLTASTTAALPVITTQVPIVNSLPEHLQQRFKVVKIVSTEPFKRGRWLCMDFTDPPTIHSEQKTDLSETTDTTHSSNTVNTAPSENQPSVAQFYEFPLNQINISNVLQQQQQIPQSVYGILLPLTNNPPPTVTKVQNVGVQATCTLPIDSMNLQTAPVQQPIATQSQATQATISTPSVSLSQAQHALVASSSAQNQTVLPTTHTQGVFPLTSQTSQPNQVLPTTQSASTLHPQIISASQQSHALNQNTPRIQPTQGVAAIPPSQLLPITQSSQILPSQPQHRVLPLQPHVQTVVQPNLPTSLPSQGISVPSTHVLPGSQTAQGIPLPQSSQGLPITQGNQGLPATQGLNIPASQAVLSSVPQMIPINQPPQILPMSQANIPMQNQPTQVLQDLPTSQPGTLNITGPQVNQMIPVTQPSQVIQSMNQMTALPVQLPITHAPQLVSGTQANSGISVAQQSIASINQPNILPATQSSTSLPTTQPGIPTTVVVDPKSSAQPIHATDSMTSSQALNKAVPSVPHPQGSEKDGQNVAALTSSPSTLPDALPDTVAGTKATQDGEEQESASTGTNTVAIDNKIEQAMDLVKSHLMFAVREEVDVLKEKITELMDKISLLEHENGILKANATPEMLNQLNSDKGGGAPPSNPQQTPAATHEHQL